MKKVKSIFFWTRNGCFSRINRSPSFETVEILEFSSCRKRRFLTAKEGHSWPYGRRKAAMALQDKLKMKRSNDEFGRM